MSFAEQERAQSVHALWILRGFFLKVRANKDGLTFLNKRLLSHWPWDHYLIWPYKETYSKKEFLDNSVKCTKKREDAKAPLAWKLMVWDLLCGVELCRLLCCVGNRLMGHITGRHTMTQTAVTKKSAALVTVIVIVVKSMGNAAFLL